MKAVMNSIQEAPRIKLCFRKAWFRALSAWEGQLNQQIGIIKNDLFLEYGVTFPKVEIKFEALPENEPVKLLLWDVAFSFDLPERPDEHSPAQLFGQLKKHLSSSKAFFVTTEIVQHHLNEVEQTNLVAAALSRLGLEGITLILRALVNEGIMIRDLPRILQAIVEADFIDSDSQEYFITDQRVAMPATDWSGSPADILKYVRASLRDQISYKFAPVSQLPVVIVDDGMRHYLDQHFPDKISEEDHAKIVDNLRSCFEGWDFNNFYPILFTDDNSRPLIWDLVRPVNPQMRVLAYSEIAPYITITEKGRLMAPA